MKLQRLHRNGSGTPQARLDRLYARLDRRLGGRLSLLVRTLAFGQDDGPLMARSIAYYALFAGFGLLPQARTDSLDPEGFRSEFCHFF